MLARKLLSTLAGSALFVTAPALAGEGPPFGGPFHPGDGTRTEETASAPEHGERPTLQEGRSAETPREGEDVPTGFEPAAGSSHSDEWPDRTMDGGG